MEEENMFYNRYMLRVSPGVVFLVTAVFKNPPNFPNPDWRITGGPSFPPGFLPDTGEAHRPITPACRIVVLEISKT